MTALDIPVRDEPRAAAAPRAQARLRRAPRPELLALVVLAGVLDLASLSTNGWANTYYSAAVRSMSASWHDFLFNSFDPSGVMTLDKPPLATWVQALSVRIFGFHPMAILVPEALMGMGTVALVYDLVRRRFGRAAGFVAGLVLALTPMTVAISRHNNPDALLALCVVAALWFTARALEDGRPRWIVAAGVALGLGFETKMLVALIVLPAVVAAWLWVAPRGRRAAGRALAAGGGALLLVGGAWPLLMLLVPAGSRPWISGTSDNSILSLIFGYNGVGRVDGQQGGPGGGIGGGGGPFGGSAGIGRLWNQALGGQAGWLLGAAAVGLIALLVASRLRRRDERTGWAILLGGAWLTSAVVFSEAKGIFHPYYVSYMAPFTAALVGAAAGLALRSERGRALRWVAPAAVVAGVAGELLVLHHQPGQFRSLVPLLVGGGVAAAAALIAGAGGRVRAAILAAVLGLLLWAPGTWAVQTIGHATSATFPAGGPASAAAGGGLGGPPGASGRAASRFRARGFGAAPGGTGGGMFGEGAQLSGVLSYIRRHGGGTLAVSGQQGASSAIIANGARVAGLGGFSGRESEVSIAWLRDEVTSGRIRWVMSAGSGGFGGAPRLGGLGLPGGAAGGPPPGAGFPAGAARGGAGLRGGPGNDGRVGSRRALTAVARACRRIPASSLASTSTAGTLYDCAGRAARLKG